ncbi:MAG: transglutaminase family protein [Gammaproteobacteria bacterium]|nr:MAG: transglutaminase family protein [Gammaproteobacteria bacterium]
MTRYQIVHRTHYEYAHPVSSSYQHLHLTPRSFAKQNVMSSDLLIEPAPTSTQTRQDYFGNPVTDIVIRSRHESLNITSRALLDVNVYENILLDLSPPWEAVAALVSEPESRDAWDAARFCYPSPHIDPREALAYAESSMAPGRPFLRSVEQITARIYEDFTYQGGVTDVQTPVEDVLRAGAGVCQDFAHLAIACVRAFGLPARYVSGYLLTRPPQGQPRLTGADASHAWISVWCPEFGWVDFDPTNNHRPRDEHITLGWGRDYSDVSPTRGFIHGGGSQQLEVSVDVTPVPLADDPAGR